MFELKSLVPVTTNTLKNKEPGGTLDLYYRPKDIYINKEV